MASALLNYRRWLLIGALALGACGDDDAGANDSGGNAGTGGSNAGSSGGAGRSGSSGGGAGRSGSSGGELPASLDPDTPLSELSAADASALCAAFDQRLSAAVTDDDIARLGCTFLALLTSAGSGGGVDAAACERAVGQCLDAGGETMSTMTCDTDRVQAATDCSITVGEYFACLDTTIDALSEWFDAFTCETLADPDVAAMAFATDLGAVYGSPECSAIRNQCPALFEEGGGRGEPSESGCEDTCSDANDGFCDDGGPRSHTDICALGTDCTDCGPR